LQNYTILDLETGYPGLIMELRDDTAAIRTARIIMSREGSHYAAFPEKFQLIRLGELVFNPEDTPKACWFFSENTPIGENLAVLKEVSKQEQK